MKQLIKTLLIIFAFSYCAQASDLSKVFESETLTIHIRDLKSGADYIYNPQRAKVRFTAFSTFKIPNSVIALETGKVTPTEVFDFIPERHRSAYRKSAAYNRDQTLTPAFRNSVVWVYQEIAGRVGREKYDTYLRKFDYGDLDTSGDIKRFWLERLKISATEQVTFLSRFYNNEFELKESTISEVKKMMLLEERGSYRVYGKTGTGKRGGDIWTGWLVGFVESDTLAYAFALNADAGSYSRLKVLRTRIFSDAFKSLGVPVSEEE